MTVNLTNGVIDLALGGDAEGDSGDSFENITGGSGNDILSAGDITVAAVHTLAGGDGDDRISAVDGETDRISCGPGHDTVIADADDVVARDCESVRR